VFKGLKVFGVRNANLGEFAAGPDDRSHRLVASMRTNYLKIYQHGLRVPPLVI